MFERLQGIAASGAEFHTGFVREEGLASRTLAIPWFWLSAGTGLACEQDALLDRAIDPHDPAEVEQPDRLIDHTRYGGDRARDGHDHRRDRKDAYCNGDC